MNWDKVLVTTRNTALVEAPLVCPAVPACLTEVNNWRFSVFSVLVDCLHIEPLL